MKKQISKKTTLTSVVLFAVLFFAVGFLMMTQKSTYAEAATKSTFIGYSSALSETDLYDQTNTYKYNTESNGDLTIKDYFITNASEKTNERVITAAPQITVITHGLGGAASHWSNIGGEFAYDSDSIMSRLDRELSKVGGNGANIYWAKMIKRKSFYLYDLKDNNNINNEKYKETVTTQKIIDNSRHIILVFEAKDSNAHNYEVYEDFNYMLSKIVYDVKLLNGGLLPKINLIGHSRGGLTNLQYTLDHPDMVASVFSIGTPYLGSNTAASDLGGVIAKNSNGRKDIITPEIYNHFYDRWKNGNYSEIPIHALGSYQTVDYLCGLLKDNKEILSENDLVLTDSQIDALNTAFNMLDKDFVSWLAGKVVPKCKDTIELFAEDIEKDGWRKAVYKNDVLVNLDSQLGKDKRGKNYGFKNYTKCYESETGKYAVPGWPYVGHNMEPRDKDFIDYILSNITAGERTERFMYTATSSNTATINGYLGGDLTGNVIIPPVIDGYTVTATGYDIFKGKGNEVTSVFLPATIKEIGDYSFANLPNLASVTIETGSGLERIGFRAFAGSSQLRKLNSTDENNLNLQASVKKIGSYAFYGTNFEKINIGSAIEDIGLAAFSNNPELKEITVAPNDNYASCDGALYETSSFGRIMQYPIGSSSQFYILPYSYEDSIKYVSESAFEGAKNLSFVHLKNVHTISRYAFSDCSKLETVDGGDKVGYIPETAFQGTAILDRAPFAYVGKILLKYNDKNFWKLTADRFPDSVEKISPFAFANDNTLTEIIIPTKVSSIEDYAFVGCGKLQSIRILSETLPQINEMPVSQCGADLEIEVRKQNIESLTEQSPWQKYRSVLSAAYTDVYFRDIDRHTRFYYGEDIDVPDCKQVGYKFKGWKQVDTTTGTTYGDYLTQSKWNSPEKEITYKADFQAITQYSLVFHNGNERVGTQNIKVGDSFVFNQKSCTVNGVQYNYSSPDKMNNCVYAGQTFPATVNGIQTAVFNGWKINGEFVKSGTWAANYDQEILDVYADWSPVEFTATLNDEFYGNSTINFYYCDVVTLPVRSRPGYAMEGWVTEDNTTLHTIENQAGDIVLYALYSSKTYKLVLISEQHIRRTINYSGAYGDVITLPELTSGQYYVYKWGKYLAKERYVFGVNNPDTFEEKVTAVWKGVSYSIEYRNLNFMGKTAELYIDGGVSSAPNYYEYGVGLELSRITAIIFYDTPYTSEMIFLGWYKDQKLTEKATYISTVDTGKKTFYAKWRYDYNQSGRLADYTITDKDPYTEEYFDTVRLHLKIDELYQELKSVGINYVYLEFKLRIREIDDGYQEVFIFKDTSPTNNPIWSVTDIEHDPSGVCTTAKYYIWRCAFSIDELKDCNYLYIRYGAHGFGKDTWVTDRIYIDTMFTVTTSSDEDIEEFTWDYSAEVKDKDCIPLENVSDSYRKRKNG